MKNITAFNAGVTWLVIITAIAKGTSTYYKISDIPPARDNRVEYNAFKPEGLVQVIVLLSSAMFQVVPVPRLNYELHPDLRERGAIILPFGLALLQGSVFFVVGWAGYFALGDAIPDNGDTFAAYFKDNNDWMVLVLQGGIGTLMYLSCPIFSVTGKAELWGQLSKPDAEGNQVSFEEAPLSVRLIINLVTIGLCTLLPLMLGRNNYMKYFTICAGTATNWMNIFLPSIVIFWVQVRPARAQGKPWIFGALKSCWIFCMGCLALQNAMGDIYQVIVGLLA